MIMVSSDTDLPIEQLRDEEDQFIHAQELAEEGMYRVCPECDDTGQLLGIECWRCVGGSYAERD